MTEKWIDEITGIYGLSDRMIFKVLVPATIVSIVLAYTYCLVNIIATNIISVIVISPLWASSERKNYCCSIF